MKEALRSTTRFSRVFNRLAPWLTAVVFLGASILVGNGWNQQRQMRLRYELRKDVRGVQQQLMSRLDRIVQLLHGAGAFWLQQDVTRREFNAFYRYRQIDQNFPYVLAFGFSVALSPEQREVHIQQVRAEGFSDYTLHPAGGRPFYSSIVYIEPFNDVNRRAFGFDMLSEPTRRAAMETSRDEGDVTVSGKVVLVQEAGTASQVAFLTYAPVYAGGFDPGSVALRRTLLRGWVYCAVRMKDLMRWYEDDPVRKRAAIAVYDGVEAADNLLYLDHDPVDGETFDDEHGLSTLVSIPLPGGKSWLIRLKAHRNEVYAADRWIPFAIAGTGLLLSLLGFFFVRSRISGYETAVNLAREMTAELQESEEKYRILTSGIPIGVALIGPDMEVIAVNERLKKWFPDPDYDQHPPCYRCFYNPARTEPCTECVVLAAMADGNQHVMERPSMTAEGEIWFKHTAIASRDETGKVRWVHEMFEDVTEQRLASERLLAERKRLYAVLDTLPSFVALIQSDYTLPYTNAEFKNRFGDPAEKRCYEALFGRGSPCDGCKSFEVFETRAPVTWEWIGPDGKTYHIVDSPFMDADGAFKVLEVGTDISDRKAAEEARAESMAAEAANLAKSRFLSHMSHEIRTPLNAILGFTQLLARDSSLGPKQAEQVRTILRSGSHLLKLINDVLDLSKIEAGGMELRLEVFRMNDLLDEVTMMFQSRVAEKDLRFLMERDANLPEFVRADETKLRQILVNIIGNAVKLTESGGIAVRVKAEDVPVETDPAGGEPARMVRLRFEVEDTGPGMDAGEIEKIFETFSQGEQGVKAGGTGLGLSISKRYIELMGGTIQVDSRKGVGSRFRFNVRVAVAEETDRIVQRQHLRVIGLEAGERSRRILVVDDIRTNRELVMDILRPIGFETLVAENGQMAVDMFERFLPDAILMDMRMPVMDGYEATRRIRKMDAGRKVPIIAVTASAFEEDREAVGSLDVTEYLRKPFRVNELLDVLQRCLMLRYRYGELKPADDGPPEASDDERADLSTLPREWIDAMIEAAENGDIMSLRKAIDRVREVDIRASRILERLANRYAYDGIRKILKKGEDADG